MGSYFNVDTCLKNRNGTIAQGHVYLPAFVPILQMKILTMTKIERGLISVPHAMTSLSVARPLRPIARMSLVLLSRMISILVCNLPVSSCLGEYMLTVSILRFLHLQRQRISHVQ